MNVDLASKMGEAFCLGVLHARRKKLAFDEAKWITVKPNGPQHTGRPALIDSATGEVLGGMGGKFNGRHISAVKQGGKFEQVGAQMQIIARNPAQKAAAMNNQRIDFKSVGAQTNKSEAQNANSLEVKKQEQSVEQEKAKTAKKSSESITNADYKKYHMPLNQLAKIERETDKAFLVNSDFSSRFDGDDTVFRSKAVWVPKSQVSSKNGYVFGMNPHWAKENGFQTLSSRELAKKRWSFPQNETSTKQTSKENVSVSSVLGTPNASSWNRKIYTYKNGERAVFINNKKIILNDEQYSKLKGLT